MSIRQKTWAVILAAGDGTRLASLTTDVSGKAVPKQYCSLSGGASLIEEATRRAAVVASPSRICAVVAARHREYWCKVPWALPARNIIVQPANRGTANGILLAVLSILERDPLARIVFLPADHYVRNEAALGRSLQEAARVLSRSSDCIALVGIEPEEADPDLGYILPGRPSADGTREVAQFIEKPIAVLARQLIATGALWNSFIFAADGSALLSILRRRLGAVVEDMSTALARDSQLHSRTRALEDLYERLDVADFSRQVMEGCETELRVVHAQACGWSDLGTPRRVAATLQRVRAEHSVDLYERAATQAFVAAHLNLAKQQARFGVAV